MRAAQNVFNHSYSVYMSVCIYLFACEFEILDKICAARTVKTIRHTIMPRGHNTKTTESIVLMEKEAAQAMYIPFMWFHKSVWFRCLL